MELGSIDDEGAARNEKKPHNQDDVRKGSFHAGGLANLKAKNLGFKIFKLEAEYSKEKTLLKERGIRVEIPGHPNSNEIGGVNEIILSKCQTISDYNSIISIIESL